MQSDTVSFRPSPEMMTMIMADCNRLRINKTDWILMKVHAALEEDKARAELKRVKIKAQEARRQIKWFHNPEKAKMILDDLIDSI
jgi:uncharacterized protein YpuA (DUF1002 family)